MLAAAKAFIRAVLWGTLAGGGPFALFIGALSLQGGAQDLPSALYVAALPLAYSGAITLFLSVVVGLPFAWLLRQQQCESLGLYQLVGAAFGALIPSLCLAAMIDFVAGGLTLIVLIPGAFAGFVTASVWGNWRMRLMRAEP